VPPRLLFEKLNRGLESFVEIVFWRKAGRAHFVHRRHGMFHVAGTLGSVFDFGSGIREPADGRGQVVEGDALSSGNVEDSRGG
jgi:hypothetical protein